MFYSYSGFSVQISSGGQNVSTGSYIFSQLLSHVCREMDSNIKFHSSLLTRKLMQKIVLNKPYNLFLHAHFLKSNRDFTATTGGYLRPNSWQNSASQLLASTENPDYGG